MIETVSVLQLFHRQEVIPAVAAFPGNEGTQFLQKLARN
jgi:hypothetical protein